MRRTMYGYGEEMKTIGDIREKFPETNIYELRSDCKYLIVIDADYIHNDFCQRIAGMVGPEAMVLSIKDPEKAVKVLEGEGTHQNWDLRAASVELEALNQRLVADVKRHTEEEERLRERIFRLSKPVTDDEWLSLCAGDHVNMTDIQRSDIDRFVAFRATEEK